MAGIEKICEFSGDYDGHSMYAYKRHSLQIMPKYRKAFRGLTATLTILKSKDYWGFDTYNQHPNIPDSNFTNKDTYERNLGEYEYIRGKLHIWIQSKHRNGYVTPTTRLKVNKRLIDYRLTVKDLKCPTGRTVFMNWSADIPTVIRKLRRLVGHKNLTIEYK